ncbi:hypothetical protein AB0F07_34550 [Streptomyces fructofermentans]|uniref:hypothetical protein n=1 Tax=Streptomyces fructofermentans TaxID=152141 RepID=UPI0033E1FC74
MPVEPAALVSAAAPDGQDAAGRAVPRPRRRGRTTLLIAAAAVLGLLAGTCAGYVVQAGRTPTELPSLSQRSVPQAKGKGPEPLSARQDRRVKTEGDLRELLLKRPKGARDGFEEGTDGWLELAAYADSYEKPGEAFSNLVEAQYRRAAVTSWQVGSTYAVGIRLVQYRQEEYAGAADHVEGARFWAEKEKSTRSWPVPGTGDGQVFVHDRPETEAGYLPVYAAEAHAWRGDVAMEIWIYDTKPIPKGKIMDLAERQMERL